MDPNCEHLDTLTETKEGEPCKRGLAFFILQVQDQFYAPPSSQCQEALQFKNSFPG